MTLGAESAGGGSLLKGQELATTFSFLRPNDLVWNYVVGNYLKGETPPPFDLLYWNSDSTNLPGPMYCWYLRNTYLENKLVEPGKPPSAARRSTSARSTRRPTSTPRARTTSCPGKAPIGAPRVLKGKRRFVLGASGHIAGVINPPPKKKRSHWIGKTAALPADPKPGSAQAEEHPGSWWTDWSDLAEAPCAASRCRAQGAGQPPAASRSSPRRDATSKRRPEPPSTAVSTGLAGSRGRAVPFHRPWRLP